MGKLFVIEGTDGSGKATQTQKLYARLQAGRYDVRKVEFPNYYSDASALIKMYLNGNFGVDPDSVNPYAASTFYAVDRYASFKTGWGSFYERGGVVVADRYTTSNMVHQAAKLTDEQDWRQYLDWLYDLEFNKFKLPVPDCVIFLDMPPEFAEKLIADRPNKSGESAKDIHERNQAYLMNSYYNALRVGEKFRWHKIPCVWQGQIREVESIHEDVYCVVSKYL